MKALLWLQDQGLVSPSPSSTDLPVRQRSLACVIHRNPEHCFLIRAQDTAAPGLLRKSMELHNRKYNPGPLNKALPSLLAGPGTSSSFAANPFADVEELGCSSPWAPLGGWTVWTGLSSFTSHLMLKASQGESDVICTAPRQTLKSQGERPTGRTSLSSVNILSWSLSTSLCPRVGISLLIYPGTPCWKSD